ncbi:hypothetical protein Q5752_000813 [Cryptotrichosporon argae]
MDTGIAETECIVGRQDAFGAKEPVPDNDLGTEIDDLLAGLGEDDLNDFNMDDFGDEVAKEQTAREEQQEVEEAHDDMIDDPFFAKSTDVPAFVGFSTARGGTLKGPSSDALARVRRLFEDEPDMARLEEAKKRRISDVQLTPVRPALPPPRHSAFSSAAATATTSTVASSETPRPPPAPASSGFQTGNGRAVAPLSAASRARAMAIFLDEPVAEPSQPPQTPTTLGFQTGLGRSAPAMTPPQRKSMRAAFLYPQFHSINDLQQFGIPDEIWQLNPTNAVHYQFIGEDAKPLGIVQALSKLKHDGGSMATMQWVENHWAMIMWKIAGQVAARPELFDEKWTWYEVVSQLKYRYEREYNLAQRPLLRRVLEHDSAAGLPMVLCVSHIHRPPPVADKDGNMVPQRPAVALSDGWYRVKAQLDECLVRAVAKGKIKVGRKLAISGAKEKYESERARLQEKCQKSIERVEDLAQLLASYAEDAEPDGIVDSGKIDTNYELLLSARDASVKLRTMSSRKICALAQYAARRVNEDAAAAKDEMEAELRTTCSPREVRSLRMVRVRDAREGRKESTRTALLNVWDARELGTLKEGGRYMVSNLMPGRQGDWRLVKEQTEVFLHTRRDSRWHYVKAAKADIVA